MAENRKEELFLQADTLLFKNKEFDKAEAVYRQIIGIDSRSIDAWNSLAYCLKFKSPQVDDKLFQALIEIYETALVLDATDVEANFNTGLLYLQFTEETSTALQHFQACVDRDDE